MGKLTSIDLKSQFEEVRKSYRLLYDYQRHVMDLAKYIGNYLGYGTETGWSIFSSSSPKDGRKNVVNFTSWDWLNMYHYEFNYECKRVGSEDVFFSIQVVSDTGFYDSKEGSLEKTSIEGFEKVDKSETKLIFIASKNIWSWVELFDGKHYETGFESGFKALDDGEKNGCIVGKAYDLSLFLNSDTTREVVEEFKLFAKSKGILM